MKLEYENDLLIVDEIVRDPSLPTQIVLRVGDEYRMIHHAQAKKPIKAEDLRPYKKAVCKDWPKAPGYQYLMAGMVPRDGFKVETGRPITADELKELCDQYSLTGDDITAEFIDKIGAIYGDKYAKTFRAIQIRVPNDEAIEVESRLRDAGIQAGNGSPGRVNISTDWGGKREGAGRKPSDRERKQYWATPEEHEKLKTYLNELRQPKED